MSKKIQVGDLVMVVKSQPCCGALSRVGQVFRVKELNQNSFACLACGNVRSSGDLLARTGKRNPDGAHDAVFVSRLIKIDPPALPESVETEKELTI